jgi:hypothetical protein
MIADEGNSIIQGEEVKAISECGMRNAECGIKNLACPQVFARWGSGWRNSDHQARRDKIFQITPPPILRKERPAIK